MAVVIGGHVSVAGGIENGVKNTLRINGQCMQFFAGSPRTWRRYLYQEEDINNFRALLKEHRLGPVFIHALYLVNLTAIDPLVLDKSITALRFDLLNSSKIGADGVIVHLGSHQGAGFKAVRAKLVDRIKSLLSESLDAVLIIENSAGQKGKIGSLEEISWLLNQLETDRVQVCIDTAHLFAAGYDLRSEDVVKDLVQTFRDLGILKRLACLHVNDCASKLSSARDIHANLGEGEIGIEGLRNFVSQNALREIPMVLEVPGDSMQKQKGPNANEIEKLVKMLEY